MKERVTLGISLMFSENMNRIKLWSVILITTPKSQRFLFAPKRMKINVLFQSSFRWSFWTSIIHSFQFIFVQFFSLWLTCIPSIYHMASWSKYPKKTWSFENTKPELKSLNFQWWQYFSCHPNLCGF
jgi:hypothetical protein